jgi:FkbM family methyltransferase
MGRAPENDFVVEAAMGSPDESSYLAAALASPEFRARHPQLVTQSQAWVWAEPNDQFILRVNLADDAIGWPAIEGQFEPAETEFMRRHTRPGAHVMDVGANVGYHTMMLASLVGPQGRVDSFEPLPHLFQALARSIARNGFDSFTSAHNVAVSDKPGRAFVRYAERTSNWGGAQLCASDEAPAGHTVVSIDTVTLDEMDVDRLDFIKIDVEGAEPMAVRGARALLRRTRPIVLSELHADALATTSSSSPREYVGLMAELGYRCHKLAHDGQLGPVRSDDENVPLQNVVFVPEEFKTIEERHDTLMARQ